MTYKAPVPIIRNTTGGYVMAMIKEKRKFNFILLAVLVVVVIIVVLFYLRVF